METTEQHKIILADDEPSNLMCLFDYLASEDYQIFTVPNGKLAFELSLKYEPDAIIMDWDMPVLDGIDAIKLIRRNPKTQDIPIIMATGKMTSVENLKKALDAGANDYIRKPFDPIEIIARIKSMIKLNLEHRKNIELRQQIAEQEITILKSELEINTSALTAAKLRLIKDGKNMAQLICDLNALRECTTTNGNKLISNIISYCKTNNTSINWEEFETLFEKVHQSFFKKVQNSFPELTINERKLCALIKLNMNTKEIAAIINKKEDTIKKAKHRLKSKLDLDKNESLYSYLQNIN